MGLPRSYAPSPGTSQRMRIRLESFNSGLGAGVPVKAGYLAASAKALGGGRPNSLPGPPCPRVWLAGSDLTTLCRVASFLARKPLVWIEDNAHDLSGERRVATASKPSERKFRVRTKIAGYGRSNHAEGMGFL